MWVIEEMRTFCPSVELHKLYNICWNLDNITNWMQLTLQLVKSIIFKIKMAIMNEEKNKIT